MEVDTQTQEFLDLYVDRNSKVYHPPATEDIEGDLATHTHLEEIQTLEGELLNRLRNTRFIG